MAVQNFYNLKAEKSVALYDVPQHAVISYIMDLPFGSRTPGSCRQGLCSGLVEAGFVARRPSSAGRSGARIRRCRDSGQRVRRRVRLTPGSALAAFRYGKALLLKGESAEGLKVLRRADELHPEMPETLVETGKAEIAAGDPLRAEKARKKVIELEPESSLAETSHFQLAQPYLRLKRPEDAERAAQKFRELQVKRSGK